MSFFVYIMMGIAVWHFAVWFPDRFWGGIVGAFIASIIGAIVIGFAIAGFQVIGRHDLYGRGIASEAVRLRMAYAWNELRLHRTHNWIALPNRGSWRANQKSGYAQIGTYPRSWHRSGEWVNEWLGEAFPHTFPSDHVPLPWRKERASKE